MPKPTPLTEAVTPEAYAKLREMAEESVLKMFAIMEPALTGMPMPLAIAFYYDCIVRMLVLMMDDVEEHMGYTPDQTAEQVLHWVTEGLAMVRDAVKMDQLATTPVGGHA